MTRGVCLKEQTGYWHDAFGWSHILTALRNIFYHRFLWPFSIYSSEKLWDLSQLCSLCHHGTWYQLRIWGKWRKKKNKKPFILFSPFTLTCACSPGRKRPWHYTTDRSAPRNGGSTCGERERHLELYDTMKQSSTTSCFVMTLFIRKRK